MSKSTVRMVPVYQGKGGEWKAACGQLHIIRIARIMKEVKFHEIERILLRDGWILKSVKGSHHQYIHAEKQGKVTIPHHTGDIAPVIIKSILKQANIQ
ncbi:MAG: type II toxin-antitoxin system HicA family toxin [Spirochaetaceae bacterium]|jgi:predicted RNA binding protein YcfA (HicA-like mRNA interferase family)|nr:type II toxin-antitoxin system HicA family toxin [Spirochaetaceae bacterium]